MANKKKPVSEWRFFRLVLTLASTILAVAIISFCTLAIINAYNNNFDNAPKFLTIMFFLLGLMSIVFFIKERTKINLIKCIFVIAINVVLGIISLFAKDNYYLFSVTAGLYCASIVVQRIFNIIQNHSVRNIILNALIIIFVVGLGIGLMTTNLDKLEQVQVVVLIECLFIAIVSFLEAMAIAMAQLKVRVLFKIIVSTFSLEVLFGLLTMIVCFSIILTSIEPNIETFPDALWYCFAVVTTIGFGDIVAVTPAGRILSVMLGLYGLIVVAVITSVIVNFYNATAGKHDQKEIEEIKQEEKKNKWVKFLISKIT